MNLTTLHGLGAGAGVGYFIGENAGPVFNAYASIAESVAGNVTNLWIASCAVLAAFVGHWLQKRGINLVAANPASPTSGKDI